MKHKFGVGMKVVMHGFQHPVLTQYNGQVVEVVKGFGTHAGERPDGSRVPYVGYQVQAVDGQLLNVAGEKLVLAPPVGRGDLDTKVSWKELEATTGYKRRPEDLV